MRYTLLRALIRLPLGLLLLCTLLSACGTPIVLTPNALPCHQMVQASGLLKPTPGAALPANETIGEIAAFGDRQTGQLDKANADKQGADAIMATCEDWQAKALAAARPKHWWQR